MQHAYLTEKTINTAIASKQITKKEVRKLKNILKNKKIIKKKDLV